MIGDQLEINDKKAIVMGYIKAARNFILQPQIYTTYSRALNYLPPYRKQLTYVLVKADSSIKPEILATNISNYTGLKARTSKNFSKLTLNYWMENTGVPINFGISVLLGFMVGAAVAGQTFYNFVLENIPQYAALKAMGLRTNILKRMIILQAGLVGMVGYGIGVGVTSIFGMFFHDSILAFRFDPVILIFSGVGIIIITSAALIALRKVVNADPVTVFRG